MFKVKNIKTNEITTVLSVYCDEYGKPWFLIWANKKWAWRAADDYVPPNYQVKYKWIVAGSRNFQNYKLLEEELNKLHDLIGEIVCGEAKGADTLGRVYGESHGIPVKCFPADWQTYGKAAGYFRNSEMAKYAHKAIVFWDGQSPGSKDMIDKMKDLGKDVTIVYYDKQGTD